VADDGAEGEERHGFFEVMVAVDPGREIEQVRILDAATERELGTLERSEPPTVRIAAPEDGAQLGERTDVAWEIEDQDTPLESIFLQLAYSPDGGNSWVPIAVDIPATVTSLTFDSTQIPASDGRGILRLFAGDGVNTVFDEVGRLTTAAAQF